MTPRTRAAALAIALWLVPHGLRGHGFEPAALDLREAAPGVFDVVWKPSGTVFNSGDTAARNVLVYVQLIDVTSGNVRDSKTIAAGDLAKGDSRTFEVSLDGECDRTYRVEVRPTAGT